MEAFHCGIYYRSSVNVLWLVYFHREGATYIPLWRWWPVCRRFRRHCPPCRCTCRDAPFGCRIFSGPCRGKWPHRSGGARSRCGATIFWDGGCRMRCKRAQCLRRGRWWCRVSSRPKSPVALNSHSKIKIELSSVPWSTDKNKTNSRNFEKNHTIFLCHKFESNNASFFQLQSNSRALLN